MAEKRRRLRAAEVRTLNEALKEVEPDVLALVNELRGIAAERIVPKMPEEARTEAVRAYVNFVLGGLVRETEFESTGDPVRDAPRGSSPEL